VVRASTAAPRYFEPERIVISQGSGEQKSVQGEFVDGGVSPFNNPALQAVMYATFDGYGIGWPLGAEKILLVSVGTGSRDRRMAPANLAVENALKALVSVMDDCADLMEIMLQWMSRSRTARVINREMGDLYKDLIAPAPLITYSRYNVSLTPESLTALGMTLPDALSENLSAMDDPANMATLQEVGARAAKQQLLNGDFPATFDLPG
jgi:hypothetical protein